MVNRAHNLQIVQVQLQNCNYFTNSAILFTKDARKIAFQRKAKQLYRCRINKNPIIKCQKHCFPSL